jgi:hypothetical protein
MLPCGCWKYVGLASALEILQAVVTQWMKNPALWAAIMAQSPPAWMLQFVELRASASVAVVVPD